MLWDTKPQYHTALVMRIDTYLHHGPVTDYTDAMRHKATVSHCTGHENRHLPASHPSNRLYRCSGTQSYSITLVMRIDTYQRHVLNISCSSHVLWLPTMLMSLMKPQDQTGHQTHWLHVLVMDCGYYLCSCHSWNYKIKRAITGTYQLHVKVADSGYERLCTLDHGEWHCDWNNETCDQKMKSHDYDESVLFGGGVGGGRCGEVFFCVCTESRHKIKHWLMEESVRKTMLLTNNWGKQLMLLTNNWGKQLLLITNNQWGQFGE